MPWSTATKTSSLSSGWNVKMPGTRAAEKVNMAGQQAKGSVFGLGDHFGDGLVDEDLGGDEELKVHGQSCRGLSLEYQRIRR
jgi:hypothetical protein